MEASKWKVVEKGSYKEPKLGFETGMEGFHFSYKDLNQRQIDSYLNDITKYGLLFPETYYVIGFCEVLDSLEVEYTIQVNQYNEVRINLDDSEM